MIKTISKDEYSVFTRHVSDLEDRKSLLTTLLSLRRKHRDLDEFIKSHFRGDLTLLASFIIANSVVHYEVEMIEERITKKTYYRRFDGPIT